MSFVEFFFIIVGFAIYPIMTHRQALQRQDAYLLLGVALLGFAVFNTKAQLAAPNLPTDRISTGFLISMTVAYCLVMCSFLLRRKNLSRPWHAHRLGVLGPIALGSLGCGMLVFFSQTPKANISAWSLLACFALQALALGWALLSPQKQHPHLVYKNGVLAVLFCISQASVLLATFVPQAYKLLPNVGPVVYLMLLGGALGQVLFQEFGQKRGRTWRNIQTTDAMAMELAYRSRRVLKDFRHDLRQPLSTLGILASVGKAISKEPEVSARYQHIQTAQRALKTMLEDFFTQLDHAIRHPHSLNPTDTLREIHIHSILDPLVAEYRLLAQSKGIELRYVPSTATALTHADMVAKIVRNGLDNAIKYTTQGGVVVGVRRRGQQHLGIQIVDTGPGLDSGKVANHHKGWGHGATMVQELSERICAKASMVTRSHGDTVYGSAFELLLPQTQHACIGSTQAQGALKHGLHAKVLAFNQESLNEAQMLFPGGSFDNVEFTLSGAYRCYLHSLRTGIHPVYIGYAHSASEHKQARDTLLLINALFEFSPCCTLMYPCNEPEKQHVHFTRSLIEIPFRPGDPASGFRLLEELFPVRNKAHGDGSHADQTQGAKGGQGSSNNSNSSASLAA